MCYKWEDRTLDIASSISYIMLCWSHHGVLSFHMLYSHQLLLPFIPLKCRKGSSYQSLFFRIMSKTFLFFLYEFSGIHIPTFSFLVLFVVIYYMCCFPEVFFGSYQSIPQCIVLCFCLVKKRIFLKIFCIRLDSYYCFVPLKIWRTSRWVWIQPFFFSSAWEINDIFFKLWSIHPFLFIFVSRYHFSFNQQLILTTT